MVLRHVAHLGGLWGSSTLPTLNGYGHLFEATTTR
jgi:hypothetical protein